MFGVRWGFLLKENFPLLSALPKNFTIFLSNIFNVFSPELENGH